MATINKTAQAKAKVERQNTIIEELANLLRQCDVTFLHYFLKLATNETHALSAAEISEQLNNLIPTPAIGEGINNSFYSEKTVKRKLDAITSGEDHFYEILELMRIIGNCETRDARSQS